MIRSDCPVSVLPEELVYLTQCHLQGAGARAASLPPDSNPFVEEMRTPEGRMKAWAWDLGWREQAFLLRPGARKN